MDEDRMKIADKLTKQDFYFFVYCSQAGKIFVDELSDADFVAFRAEYGIAPEIVAALKEKFLPTQAFDSPATDFNFADSDEPLHKIFKITSPEKYRNFLLADLPFTNRVQNVFDKNNFKNLADLLQMSPKNFSQLKNLGKGSVENIFAVLKKILSRVVLEPARPNIDVDEELQQAFKNNLGYAKILIAAFEEFSRPILAKTELYRAARKKINSLPEEFQQHKLQPFLQVFGAENLHVPETLLVADLPQFVFEHSTALDSAQVEKILDKLTFAGSVKNVLTETVLKMKSNYLEVIIERLSGKTLQEIGDNLNLTRERVRQMAAKILDRFSSQTLLTAIKLLRALNYEKTFLNRADYENFFGVELSGIIWFITVHKKNLFGKNFHYDKKLQAIIFTDKKTLPDAKILQLLPEIFIEDDLKTLTEKIAAEQSISANFLTAKVDQLYKKTGKIFHRKKLSVSNVCGYILRGHFQSGYKIADSADYEKFCHCVAQYFGDAYKFSPRTLDAIIYNIGVLCDRGKYIHRDFLNVDKKIADEINDFIEKFPRDVVPFKEIFNAMRERLQGTQITNAYFLQGVLQFFGCRYKMKRDYVTKDEDKNVAAEFTDFVKSRGEVSNTEILAEFTSFTDANIQLLLPNCPEVIKIDEGNYMHTSLIKITDAEKVLLKNLLKKICATAPVNMRRVLDIFSADFQDFVIANKTIERPGKLFGILKFLFSDDFYFSRPYIALNDITNLTNKEFLLQKLDSLNKIKVADLIQLCKDQGVHIVSNSLLVDSLQPEFLRVDESFLARTESTGVTAEITKQVADFVRGELESHGGFLAARSFSSFGRLPKLNFAWTDFLLESVIKLSGEIKILSIKTSAKNLSRAIFVSEKFSGDDFHSFVSKVLREENSAEPFKSAEAILTFLQDRGLCGKKLPAFLLAEGFAKFFKT